MVDTALGTSISKDQFDFEWWKKKKNSSGLNKIHLFIFSWFVYLMPLLSQAPFGVLDRVNAHKEKSQLSWSLHFRLCIQNINQSKQSVYIMSDSWLWASRAGILEFMLSGQRGPVEKAAFVQNLKAVWGCKAFEYLETHSRQREECSVQAPRYGSEAEQWKGECNRR